MKTTQHNRASIIGKVMGKRLAILADPCVDRLIQTGVPDNRCSTCAFRRGTEPNGCTQTQLDALKAIAEKVPFHCHSEGREHEPCHGWAAITGALTDAPVEKCDWQFSPHEVISHHASK